MFDAGHVASSCSGRIEFEGYGTRIWMRRTYLHLAPSGVVVHECVLLNGRFISIVPTSYSARRFGVPSVDIRTAIPAPRLDISIQGWLSISRSDCIKCCLEWYNIHHMRRDYATRVA